MHQMPRGLDYEEQYEMLVKYKTRLFRTEQVLLPCGTNVGPMWAGMFSRMFSHTSELAHLAIFGPWLVLDYRQMQMPLTRLPNCMMLGKGKPTDD